MSFLRLNAVTKAPTTVNTKAQIYFDSGANAVCAVDSGNNRTVLGTLNGNSSYRYVGFTTIQTGTTTYNSQAHGPVTALLIEMVGGGGGGGGGKNGNTTSTSFGAGGGGGAYSAAFVTLAALAYTNNNAMVVAVGAGGTATTSVWSSPIRTGARWPVRRITCTLRSRTCTM